MISTNTIRRAGLAIILAWGWKRAAIALAAGALSALAMAPFNAWPVLFVTFPVAIWLIDGAGAGRWRGDAGGGDVGLLVRARLFRGRALLDRPGLSGRCGDLRLADAVRRAGSARLPRIVHRGRLCTGPLLVDPRCVAAVGTRAQPYDHGVAARPSALGISVEFIRLRPVRTAGAGADRLADRAVGHDVPERSDLREPRGPDRRQFARAKALAGAGGRTDIARRDGRVRHGPIVATADRVDQGQAAHHAAQFAAGRQIQLRRQGGGDAEIS